MESDGGRTKYFKGEKVGDYVARDIVHTTGMDYKKVYNDLLDLARNRGYQKDGQDDEYPEQSRGEEESRQKRFETLHRKRPRLYLDLILQYRQRH